jgi:NADP-dependent 3-hydroxy acid dehydrogenase YdfG
MSDKKLVVITGASSGIGARIAKDFDEKGHPTLLLARRVEKMKEIGLSENAMIIKCDVTDQKEFQKAIEAAGITILLK